MVQCHLALAVVGLLALLTRTSDAPATARLPSVVAGVDTVLREELPAAPGRRLTLALHTGARVRVEGWDRDAVRVEADLREAACPGARVRVAPDPAGVRVVSEFTTPGGLGGNRNCSLAVDVRVPRRFDVALTSLGGAVAMADVSGELTGHTNGGDLELRRVAGRVRLDTYAGDLVATDVQAAGVLKTLVGHVRFRNVSGGLRSEVTVVPGS